MALRRPVRSGGPIPERRWHVSEAGTKSSRHTPVIPEDDPLHQTVEGNHGHEMAAALFACLSVTDPRIDLCAAHVLGVDLLAVDPEPVDDQPGLVTDGRLRRGIRQAHGRSQLLGCWRHDRVLVGARSAELARMSS